MGHSGNECLKGRRNGGDPNVLADPFGSWLRVVPVRVGGVNRRVREKVHSEDDLEGSGSHGEQGVLGGGGERVGQLRRWLIGPKGLRR